ncbi:MAG: hypothetical protein IPK60_20420 [Sandaracinaceae bacterium]|nr:hypothetical protein [Sandaracinaceae bacterium]
MLSRSGQIERVGAPAVLATLTAHHVLERVDYPQTAFRFEHQQLQEYYAALDVRARLLDLQSGDDRATNRFTADYVNDPAWAEPLRMIAETIGDAAGDGETDRRNTSAGGTLVAMALDVDLVFAGELARLCGTAVWNEVPAQPSASASVPSTRSATVAFGSMPSPRRRHWRGRPGDIIVPLLSG